jgi:hypothetical protein
MHYRCEATTVEGFVQQLACCYLPHGYWFYVSGWVPAGKDPRAVDQKLQEKYGIAISRQTRARRKLAGLANLHYLRHGRLFVLLATHGKHCYFEEEGERVRDIRRLPLHFAGYSITYKQGDFKAGTGSDEPAEPDDKWHSRVQIGQEAYRDLKAYFLERAVRTPAEVLGRELYTVPFEPYARVRQQMLNVLRLLNDARRRAGDESLPPTVLRYQRRIVKPFDAAEVRKKSSREGGTQAEECREPRGRTVATGLMSAPLTFREEETR